MEMAVIPNFLLATLLSDPQRRSHLNVLLTSMAVLGGIALLAWYPAAAATVPRLCLFRALLGIPCPGCGITTSLIAVAAGDRVTSWQSNPVGIFLFYFLVLQLPLRITAIASVSLEPTISSFSRRMSILITMSLFLVWGVRLAF
jgi:hypothetical protein